MTDRTVCFVHGDSLDLFRGENGPRFGGSETQMYLLAKMLADAGDFGVRMVADKPVDGAVYPGVSFRAQTPAIQRGVPYLSRFINRARRHEPYRDLDQAVLIQTILGGYTTFTWQTARELGMKFVYRMSCDADIDGSFFEPEVRKQFHAAVRDADGVMAQSERQRERLRDELGVESTVVRSVVELPVDGPRVGGDYVLWAGRGAPIKRPWIMIETARVMPDIQFVMLMPVEDYFDGRLFWRCVAQEAAGIPNLTIVPGVSYFEMARYYRDAAVFVSTSAIEGVPSAFLQAAAQGTPVISLDVDPDGMLNEGGMGYCAGADVGALRTTIAQYMTDPSVLEARSLQAYDYVRSLHSTDAVHPVFVAFLDAVFGR